jgi:flagellar hook assembly protein FlgD
MKKTLIPILAIGAAAFLVLAGCQTAKPVTIGQSMIQTEASGFSPNAEKGHDTIGFNLLFGNEDLVSTWKVEIQGSSGTAKTFTGDAKSLPSVITWDGNSDTGAQVAEGTYTASLSIDYGKKLPAASESSRSFVVDLTPPSATVSANPGELTPTDNGVAAPVTVKVDAQSKVAKIQSWSLEVFDPDGKLFQSFSGKWPDNTVSWDGKSLSGSYVQPSATYSAVVTISDEYGLRGEAKAAIPVAALTVAAAAPVAQPAPVAKPAPVAPAPRGLDWVRPSLAGFSPKAASGPKAIDLALGFADPAGVKSWTLAIVPSEGGPQKTFSGSGAGVPSVVSWDGMTDSGSLAPEGTYTSVLTVDYGSADAKPVTSTPFVLDITPPSGTLSLSSPLFSPIESSDTITLTVNASSQTAKIDSWSMHIYDPGNNLFKSFDGRWPARSVAWDGKGISGDMVQSAEDYPVQVTVRDQFGNVGTLKGTVPVDILVEKTATGYRILASRIFFKAFTADYRDVPPELATQNMARLDALAEKLKKFPGYKITLVGHAVMINWDKPAAGKIEQKEILIPLSQSRAAAIEQALVDRGLPAATFTTEGVGASEQLVPDSDYANRWQNRRVALYIDKESK